jgi:hypothetical protein
MSSPNASQVRDIPSVRIAPSSDEVLNNLGPLADLTGSWHGHGFNLVARPDLQANTNLFLELNLTDETLKFDPISSSIPNRGFGQVDAELFGLTYLQKISDRTTGGALHIEPGIWVYMPTTTDPKLPASVFRMGSIPHGNALLAQGVASTFNTAPVVGPGSTATGANPSASLFPSFNTTPFAVSVTPTPPTPANPPFAPATVAPIFFAGGSSEFLSAPPAAHGGFTQYTLTNAFSNTNTRTPLGNVPAVLPPEITQTLLNDPITLLQNEILNLIAEGHSFEGTALNIATSTPILFGTNPNQSTPNTSVTVPAGGGDIGNIPFLKNNATSALTYATFWITKVSHPKRPSFMQLQYAQMVLLNFPALLIPDSPIFAWPHVSVATLHKTFG